MLLSEDGRDTFLCDFGYAERLDNQGQSLSGSKGEHRAITAIKLSMMGNLSASAVLIASLMLSNTELKGSETHMAPEIVKGEPRGAKADVWSSCCMFLHMVNGCQPWTRYYTCRLYLKVYFPAMRVNHNLFLFPRRIYSS